MWNIALNTFREIIRNKFFSLIAFLGVVFLLLSIILDTLALGEIRRVLFDFGLSFIELTWFAIILFLWGGMIAREIDGKTIYLMLSKPVSRGSIVLGKFFGFLVVLFLVIVLETTILISILVFKGFVPDMIFFLAVLGIYLKLLSLLALILFFSTFVSPMIAMFMTIASYVIGHSGYTMLEYAFQAKDSFLSTFATAILTFFPNLESLNLKNYVATDAPLHLNTYYIAYGTSVLYIAVILFLAMKLFERRSFDAI